VRVSAPPARSTVLTQIVAGDPGRVAIAFQGADTGVVSDNVAKGTEWFVYASFSEDALCWWKKSCVGNGPAFEQTRVSQRTNHVNEICVSGIGCTVNGKDRTLLDFFDIGIDTDGRVGVVWTDTQNRLASGTIMFAKVLNGPSLYAAKPAFRAAMPKPGKRGPAGDAIWPVNGTPGANNRAADLTGDALTAAGESLKVSVNVGAADLAGALDAGYRTTHVKYVTRWHYGADAYFVAADFDGTNTTFYGGMIDDNDALYSPVSGPTAVFGMKYVKDFDVEGTFADGVLSFTVPRANVGSPKNGDTLYSVQSFTIAGLPDAAVTLYTAPDTIDATPPVDIVLGKSTSVLGTKTTKKPAPKNKGSLASTGVGDAGMILGVALIALAAITRRMIRRTEDFS
jgi:hypothetical protein